MSTPCLLLWHFFMDSSFCCVPWLKACTPDMSAVFRNSLCANYCQHVLPVPHANNCGSDDELLLVGHFGLRCAWLWRHVRCLLVMRSALNSGCLIDANVICNGSEDTATIVIPLSALIFVPRTGAQFLFPTSNSEQPSVHSAVNQIWLEGRVFVWFQ
jgi:hypothetical protein